MNGVVLVALAARLAFAADAGFDWRYDAQTGTVVLWSAGAAFTITANRSCTIRAKNSGVRVWVNGRRRRDESFYPHKVTAAAALVESGDRREVAVKMSMADSEGRVAEGVELELRAAMDRAAPQLHVHARLRNVSESVWPRAIMVWHFNSDSATYITPGPQEWTYRGAWGRGLGLPGWVHMPATGGGLALFSRVGLRENGGGPGRTSLSAHGAYRPVPPGDTIPAEFSLASSAGPDQAASAYRRRRFPTAGVAEAMAKAEAQPFRQERLIDLVAPKRPDPNFGFTVDPGQSAIEFRTGSARYRVHPGRGSMISVVGSGARVKLSCRMRRSEVLLPRALRDLSVEADTAGHKRVRARYSLAPRGGTDKSECELVIVLEIWEGSDALALHTTLRNLTDEPWDKSHLMWQVYFDRPGYYTPGPRQWRYEGKWKAPAGQPAWLYVPHSEGGLGALSDGTIGEGGSGKLSVLIVSKGYAVTPARGERDLHMVLFPARSPDDAALGCLRQTVSITLDRPAYLPGEAIRVHRLRAPAGVAERVRSVRAVLAKVEGRHVARWSFPLAALAGQAFPLGELADGEYRLAVELCDGSGQCVAAGLVRCRLAGEEHRRLAHQVEQGRQGLAATPPAVQPDGRSRLAALEAALDRRDYALAQRHARRVAVWLDSVKSGREEYFARVVAAGPGAEAGAQPWITVSWRSSPDRLGEAIEWAKRMGATELCFMGQPGREELLRVRSAGLRTAALFKGLVACYEWTQAHPEHRQMAYYVTPAVKASGPVVELPLPAKRVGWRAIVDLEHNRKWAVVQDATRGRDLPKTQWTLDDKTRHIRITQPEPGHSYRGYYTLVHSRGDPAYREFRQHAISVLDEYLAGLDGALQTFFTDDTAYAWLGNMPGGGYEWDSYHFGSSPALQAAFRKATGRAFHPRMLVGTDIPQSPPLRAALDTADNRPPSDDLLAHRRVVQQVTNDWARAVTDACRRRGVELWHYWGDAHIGVEPYLGGLDAGGIAHVDKPCWGSRDCATILRALTDFPGPAKRRTRLRWVTHATPKPDPAAELMTVWTEAKRALLFKMIDGLYWMPFQAVPDLTDAAKREDMLEAIHRINREFAFLHARLHGQRVFTHDLTVYVVNAWGRVYSWRPWPNRRGLPVFLENLTDLPIRVKFLSLRELAGGVPKDADVLVNYGLPGSSWNGGYLWSRPGVVRSVAKFVAAGGGLIGVASPSHFRQGETTWHLRDLLGVEADGSGAKAIEATATPAAKSDWLTRGMPDRLALADGWPAKAVQPDLRVLYSEAGLPAVAVRDVGRGRSCYINGYSTGPEYYRLLRRCVFWCARREADLPRLCSETAGVFTYFYPGRRLLVVYNSGAGRVAARVRFDPGLLPGPAPAGATLWDELAGAAAFTGPAARLREGFTLPLAPGTARFLTVR